MMRQVRLALRLSLRKFPEKDLVVITKTGRKAPGFSRGEVQGEEKTNTTKLHVVCNSSNLTILSPDSQDQYSGVIDIGEVSVE